MEAISLKEGQPTRGMRWALCLLWIVAIALCGCGKDDVPVELIGEWETSARNYEDCTLSISSKMVAFRKGSTHALLYKVAGVETILDGRVNYYVLRYKNDDGKINRLSLSLKNTLKGLEIQFSNQQNLKWTRKKPSPREGLRNKLSNLKEDKT